MQEMKNYLIVVDMQKDFVDGILGTPEAKAIVDSVAARIRSFDGDVLYTLDTHQENYLETQEGARLPVVHCVEGTEGWQLEETVRQALEQKGVLDEAHGVKKDTFGSRELPERIRDLSEGEARLSFTLIGVCTDMCVISNAMVLKAFFPEALIFVDARCCAGVTPERHRQALETMRYCQMEVLGA